MTGLPDPEKDPVSPLLAMIGNAVVMTVGDGGAALVGKAIDGAKNMGDRAMTSVAKAATASHLGEGNTAPSGDTIKAQKERELSVAKEVPTIPEHVQASALNAVGKSEEASKGREAANESHFVGAQGVSTQIENLGKPIAVAAQTQSMGLGMG